MSSGPAPRLEVLKALGDNTRYAIYLELARAPRPLATAEVAASLGLHVNTVRPHLERMRDAGLLELEVGARGTVGRPQHRYALAADAPSLGLEPPIYPLATDLLLRAAAAAGLSGSDTVDVGREQGRTEGRAAAEGPGDRPDCVAALVERLSELGFDPATIEHDEGATVAFCHCPFRALAEAHPDLVCGLHRGLVEGFVEGLDPSSAVRFRSLVDRDPCQVDVLIDGMPS
jgi:predicted ArsR family transcriptional regulator